LQNGAAFTDLAKLGDAEWVEMREKIKAQNDKDRTGRTV
jgi:hypothetical protein